MLKRISAISAAVTGALLIGAGAQAATGTQLQCDRPLSSVTPANCVLQSPGSAPERVAVVTSAGEPVRSAASSERVLIVSEPSVAGAPVYIVEPASGSSLRRGEQVVIVTQPMVIEGSRSESSRNDAFPDPSPPSAAGSQPRNLDPSDTRDRALGRHVQPD
jgi:hypothetical protein